MGNNSNSPECGSKEIFKLKVAFPRLQMAIIVINNHQIHLNIDEKMHIEASQSFDLSFSPLIPDIIFVKCFHCLYFFLYS